MEKTHISILQDFKKVCKFLNKHKKKILLFVISLIILISLLFRIGILTPSKNFYIGYFESNKNDFESVVDYFEKNDSITGYLLWNDLNDFYKIDDTSVKQSVIKILYFGNFGSISGSSVSSVSFSFSNLIDRVGEPIAIVYDSTHNNEEWSEDYWAKNDEYIKCSYSYEPLGDNWYYEYRSR